MQRGSTAGAARPGGSARGALPVAWATGVLALAGSFGTGDVLSQDAAAQPRAAVPAPRQPDYADVQIQVLPVQGKVYLLAGAGGNTTVQVGDDGALVVDTMFAPLADKIVAEIRKLTAEPIRYVVNTHVHPDHTGGNEAIAAQGFSFGGANIARQLGEDAIKGAKIVAHENVLHRLARPPEGATGAPSGAWPTDTYFEGVHDIYFNGETVRLIHAPGAHTDGDSIVYFRGSDVIATGDLFTTVMYPFIDHARGGSIDGIIAGLNTVLDIAVPRWQQEGGTMIVPGHGRIADEHEVVEYRDMLVIIRGRIQDMVDRGMTLEQVKAARPTLDYDARFGRDSGFWTTAQFIEAVYRDVSRSRETS